MADGCLRSVAHLPQQRADFVATLRRDDQIEGIPADRLGGAPPEDPFRCRVPVCDARRLVPHDVGQRHPLDVEAQPLEVLLAGYFASAALALGATAIHEQGELTGDRLQRGHQLLVVSLPRAAAEFEHAQKIAAARHRDPDGLVDGLLAVGIRPRTRGVRRLASDPEGRGGGPDAARKTAPAPGLDTDGCLRRRLHPPIRMRPGRRAAQRFSLAEPEGPLTPAERLAEAAQQLGGCDGQRVRSRQRGGGQDLRAQSLFEPLPRRQVENRGDALVDPARHPREREEHRHARAVPVPVLLLVRARAAGRDRLLYRSQIAGQVFGGCLVVPVDGSGLEVFPRVSQQLQEVVVGFEQSTVEMAADDADGAFLDQAAQPFRILVECHGQRARAVRHRRAQARAADPLSRGVELRRQSREERAPPPLGAHDHRLAGERAVEGGEEGVPVGELEDIGDRTSDQLFDACAESLDSGTARGGDAELAVDRPERHVERREEIVDRPEIRPGRHARDTGGARIGSPAHRSGGSVGRPEE